MTRGRNSSFASREARATHAIYYNPRAPQPIPPRQQRQTAGECLRNRRRALGRQATSMRASQDRSGHVPEPLFTAYHYTDPAYPDQEFHVEYDVNPRYPAGEYPEGAHPTAYQNQEADSGEDFTARPLCLNDDPYVDAEVDSDEWDHNDTTIQSDHDDHGNLIPGANADDEHGSGDMGHRTQHEESTANTTSAQEGFPESTGILRFSPCPDPRAPEHVDLRRPSPANEPCPSRHSQPSQRCSDVYLSPHTEGPCYISSHAGPSELNPSHHLSRVRRRPESRPHHTSQRLSIPRENNDSLPASQPRDMRRPDRIDNAAEPSSNRRAYTLILAFLSLGLAATWVPIWRFGDSVTSWPLPGADATSPSLHLNVFAPMQTDVLTNLMFAATPATPAPGDLEGDGKTRSRTALSLIGLVVGGLAAWIVFLLLRSFVCKGRGRGWRGLFSI